MTQWLVSAALQLSAAESKPVLLGRRRCTLTLFSFSQKVTICDFILNFARVHNECQGGP